VVESCGLTKPDVGEQYWRIPAEISAQGLQVHQKYKKIIVDFPADWKISLF
jgi:hypothetical protein